MITWLDAPVEITPATQNSWQDSATSVPAGASGAIVVFQNNVTANPPGDKNIGVRCKGASDAYLSKGYWNNDPAGIGTQNEVYVAVDKDGAFQVFIEDTTLSKAYLIGYFEQNYDTFFRVNAVDVTPTRDATWRTVSISAYTDGKRATGAILLLYQPDASYEALGVRAVGYTGAEVKQGFWFSSTVIPLNASQQFEANVDAGGNSKILLIGFVTGGVIATHTVGPWIDTTVSQQHESLTLFDRQADGFEPTAWVSFQWYGVSTNSAGTRHRRWRESGYDVHNKLCKDGSIWKLQPVDSSRKCDQYYHDRANQYAFCHAVLGRGVPPPNRLNIALIYASVSDATQRTSTATSWAEVTQYTLSYSAMQAAGLSSGDNVIIIAKANVGGSDTTALSSQFRVSRGTSFAGATAWDDSVSIRKPINGGAAFGHPWQWVKKHTLVASENIYFALQTTSGDTALADDFCLIVMKLDGPGGLGPDNYAYAETTPAGDAGTSYTDGASVTIPGRNKGVWAVFGSAHWLVDSTSAILSQRITIGSENLAEIKMLGADTGEEYVHANLAVRHQISSDTTAKLQYMSDTASTHDCNRTAVFAMRVDAFESYCVDDKLQNATLDTLDTYVDICPAGFIQRNPTAQNVLFFAAAFTGAVGENTKAIYGRVYEPRGAADWPSAGADRASYMTNGSADKIPLFVMGIKTGLAAGSYDPKFQAAEDSDVTPSYTVDYGAMFCIAPRLKVSNFGHEQFAYRGRNDDGSESAATWKAAQNTTFSVAENSTFRVRFGLNIKGLAANLSAKLLGRKQGKTWRQIS